VKHTASVEIITPEEAAEYLAKNNFSGQRALSKDHVAFLSDTRRQGQFDGGAPIRFAQHDGTWWLVDGQHRLAMISGADEPVEMVVVRTVCESAQQVADLYSRIDRGRGRNLTDALRALGIYKGAAMTPTQMSVFAATVPILAGELQGAVRGSSYISKSAEARVALMQDWSHAAEMYFSAVDGSPHSGLFKRREVMAVGLVTFADAQHSALEFWRGAAMDDGLQATDPRKQMLLYMMRTRPSHHGVGFLIHGVAACWNAWHRGDHLKMVKVMDVSAPVKLAGTRYAKREPKA
jgi:hypothetical protein